MLGGRIGCKVLEDPVPIRWLRLAEVPSLEVVDMQVGNVNVPWCRGFATAVRVLAAMSRLVTASGCYG